MFPFSQLGKAGEVSFQFQAGDPEEQQELQQIDDLTIYNQYHEQDLYGSGSGPAAMPPESNTITFSPMRAPAARPRGRGRARGGRGEEDEEKRKKKMQHKEIERQRRQEMAALFSSLRSLLPLDYVKGKRSISDHIAESANYIKQLQGRIKELGDTRDQLLLSTTTTSTTTATTSTRIGPASTTIANNVEVFLSSSSSAVHVQITCREDAPLLSASLNVLLQAGLDVLSCVTNRIPDGGGALLHNIHCQLPTTPSGWSEIDVHHLQQTLYQLISTT